MFHRVRLVPDLVACSKRERGYAPGASCGARPDSAPIPRAPVSPLPPEADTVQETGVRALTSPPSRSAALSVSRERPRLAQSALFVRRGSSRAKLSGSRVDEEWLGAILHSTVRVTFPSCDGLCQSFSLGASFLLIPQFCPHWQRTGVLQRCRDVSDWPRRSTAVHVGSHHYSMCPYGPQMHNRRTRFSKII